MSREIGNVQARAIFFRYSAVLCLPGVLLRKLPYSFHDPVIPTERISKCAEAFIRKLIESMYLRGKNDFQNDSGSKLEFSTRAHAQLSYIHICTYHMEEITGKLLYIYRNCFILTIDPSG